MTTVRTQHAELEVDERGPHDGAAVVLLHGFPDVPATWDEVIGRLPAGLRIVRPSLRGTGGSRALPGAESGQVAALADDVLGLLDALDLRDVVLVGHDWGARAAHAAAAADPSRLRGLVTLSTAYGPRTGLTAEQSLADVAVAWYRWWLCTAEGAAAFRADPRPLLRLAWREWSPALGLDDAELAAVLDAGNDQFVETVVHYYRHGAGEAEGAPPYAALQDRLDAWPSITVPTTFLVGTADGCETLPPAHAAAPWFRAGCDVRVLDGIGHFVQREAPETVAAAVREHLAG